MQAHCKYAMNDRVRVMNMRDSLHEVIQMLRERRGIGVTSVTITANLLQASCIGWLNKCVVCSDVRSIHPSASITRGSLDTLMGTIY